jgi:hypothetical protein
MSTEQFSLTRPLDTRLNFAAEIPHFYRDKTSDFCSATLVFNNSDLDALCHIGINCAAGHAVGHVQNSPVVSPFFNDIADAVNKLNDLFYQFEISSICSGFYFVFLNEHVSLGHWQSVKTAGGSSTKLLGLISLSNPDLSSGGELEMLTSEGVRRFHYGRGMIYLLPSWSFFRFSPVSRGTRLWMYFTVSGPSFR